MRKCLGLALLALITFSALSIGISVVPQLLAQTGYSLKVLNTSIAPGEYVDYSLTYYGTGPYNVYVYIYAITGGLCSDVLSIAKKLGTTPLALMESVWSKNKVDKAPYRVYGYTIWAYNRLEKKNLAASGSPVTFRLRLVDLITSVPKSLENAPASMLNLSLPYLGIGGTVNHLPTICTMVAVCSSLGCSYSFKNLLVIPLVMVKPRFEAFYPCTMHLNAAAKKLFIELDVWGVVGARVTGIEIASHGKEVMSISGSSLLDYLVLNSNIVPNSAGHIALYLGASKLSLPDGLYNVSLSFNVTYPTLVGVPKHYSITYHLASAKYTALLTEWYYYIDGVKYLYLPYTGLAMVSIRPIVLIGGALKKPVPWAAITYGKYSGYVSRLVIAVAGVKASSVDIVLKPVTKFSREYVWASNVKPPAAVSMEKPSNMTAGVYAVLIRNAATGKYIEYSKECSIYALGVLPIVEVVKSVAQPVVNESTSRIVVEKGVGPIVLHIYGFAKGPRTVEVYTLNSTSGKPVKLIAAAKEYHFPQKIVEVAKTSPNGAATVYVYVPLSTSLVGGKNVLLVTDGIVKAKNVSYILPTVYWRKLSTTVTGKAKLPGVDLASPIVTAIDRVYGQVLLVGEGKPLDHLGDTIYVNAFAAPPSSVTEINITSPTGISIYEVCTSIPCTFAVPPLPKGEYSVVAYFKLSKPVMGLAPGSWLAASASFFNTTFYTVSKMVVVPKVVLVKLGALPKAKPLPVLKLVRRTTLVKETPFEGLDVALVLGTGFAPNDSVVAVLLNGTDALMSVDYHSIELWSTNALGEIVSSVGKPALYIPIMQSGLYAITVVGKKSGSSEPAYMRIVDRTLVAARMVMGAVSTMRYAIEDELRALSSEIYVVSTSLTSVIEALANETGALSTSVSNLGTQLSSKIVELEKVYRASYANLSRALNEIESGIVELSKSVKTLQSGIGTVSANITAVQSSLGKLRASVAELSKALALLRASVSALPSKIVNPLSLEISKASKNVTKSIAAVGSELKSTLISVNSSIESSIASLETVVKSVGSAIESSIASNTTALEKLINERYSSLKAGIESLSSEARAISRTLGSISSLLESMNATLGTLATRAQVQSLEKVMLSKFSALSSSVASANAKLSAVSSSLSVLNKKVSSVELALTKVAKASQVEQLSKRVSGVSSRLGIVQGLIIATLILSIIAAVSSSIALAQLRRGRQG